MCMETKGLLVWFLSLESHILLTLHWYWRSRWLLRYNSWSTWSIGHRSPSSSLSLPKIPISPCHMPDISSFRAKYPSFPCLLFFTWCKNSQGIMNNLPTRSKSSLIPTDAIIQNLFESIGEYFGNDLLQDFTKTCGSVVPKSSWVFHFRN